MDLNEFLKNTKKINKKDLEVNKKDLPNLEFRNSLKKKALLAGAIGVGLIGASSAVNAGLVLRSNGVNYPVENFISVAPSISTNQVAYASAAGRLAGSAKLTWDNTAGTLTLTGGTLQSTITKGLVVNSGIGSAVADSFNAKSSTDQYMIYANAVNGFVGIGTNAPTRKLHIVDDGIRIQTAKTPASATATGNAGDICWDASYVYVCVATNTWKRSAIVTW